MKRSPAEKSKSSSESGKRSRAAPLKCAFPGCTRNGSNSIAACKDHDQIQCERCCKMLCSGDNFTGEGKIPISEVQCHLCGYDGFVHMICLEEGEGVAQFGCKKCKSKLSGSLKRERKRQGDESSSTEIQVRLEDRLNSIFIPYLPQDTVGDLVARAAEKLGVDASLYGLSICDEIDYDDNSGGLEVLSASALAGNMGIGPGTTLILKRVTDGESEQSDEEERDFSAEDMLQKATDLVNDIKKAAQSVGTEESTQRLVDDVDRVMSKIRSSKMRFVLVGEKGAGKSELVNRICMGDKGEGKLPLPSMYGASSVTRFVTEVSRSKVWSVGFKHKKAGGDEEYVEVKSFGETMEEVAKIYGILCKFCAAYRMIVGNNALQDADIENRVLCIHVKGPFPTLPDDVVLVDTPGLEGDAPSNLLNRTLDAARSADVLVPVSGRIPTDVLEKMLLHGVFYGSNLRMVVGAFFEDDSLMSEGKSKQVVDAFRDEVRRLMFQNMRIEGTLQQALQRIKQVSGSATVLFRNDLLNNRRTEMALFERVRQDLRARDFTDLYGVCATLWFSLNMKTKGKEKSASKSSKVISTILDHMQDDIGNNWEVSEAVKVREAQCVNAYIRAMLDASFSSLETLDRSVGDLRELMEPVSRSQRDEEPLELLHRLLLQLWEEMMDYTASAINARAEFAGKNYYGRVVTNKDLGTRYKALSINDEGNSEEDDGEGGDMADMLPRLFIRQAKEELGKYKSAAWMEVQELWKLGRIGDLVQDLAIPSTCVSERRVEAFASTQFRKVVTRPAMEVLLEMARKVVSGITSWTLSMSQQCNSGRSVANELPHLLGRMKKLFAAYSTRDKSGKLPVTTLANPMIEADKVEDMVTLLRKLKGEASKPIADWGVVQLRTPSHEQLCYDDSLPPRVLKLCWNGPASLHLMSSRDSWDLVEDYARCIRSSYQFIPDTASSQNTAQGQINNQKVLLSPMFCFAFSKQTKDVRCNNLFSSEWEEDHFMTRRMLVYVIYEDQVQAFQHLLERDDSTYLMTLPADANLLVGEDSIKLLCEELGLPFRWTIPSHMEQAYRFFRNVIQTRKCSPAVMFHFVEHGQLGPLLQHTLKGVAALFKNQQSVHAQLYASLRNLPREEDFGEKVSLFSKFTSESSFGLSDVMLLLRNIESDWFQASEGSKELVAALKNVMSVFMNISCVVVKHSMVFLVQYLRNSETTVHTFEARKNPDQAECLLRNVFAEKPFSHFDGRHGKDAWVNDLRIGRPENEDEMRKQHLLNIKKILGSCSRAGMATLTNLQYSWTGQLKVQKPSRRRRRKGAGQKRPTQKRKVITQLNAVEESDYVQEPAHPSPLLNDAVSERILRMGLSHLKFQKECRTREEALVNLLEDEPPVTRFHLIRWLKDHPSFEHVFVLDVKRDLIACVTAVRRVESLVKEDQVLEFFSYLSSILGRAVIYVTPDQEVCVGPDGEFDLDQAQNDPATILLVRESVNQFRASMMQ